jgi:hypothetical protein
MGIGGIRWHEFTEFCCSSHEVGIRPHSTAKRGEASLMLLGWTLSPRRVITTQKIPYAAAWREHHTPTWCFCSRSSPRMICRVLFRSEGMRCFFW